MGCITYKLEICIANEGNPNSELCHELSNPNSATNLTLYQNCAVSCKNNFGEKVKLILEPIQAAAAGANSSGLTARRPRARTRPSSTITRPRGQLEPPPRTPSPCWTRTRTWRTQCQRRGTGSSTGTLHYLHYLFYLIVFVLVSIAGRRGYRAENLDPLSKRKVNIPRILCRAKVSC